MFKKIKSKDVKLHPALLFLILTILVMIISSVGSILHLETSYYTVNIATGELEPHIVTINNLFNRTGIQYLISNLLNNFTSAVYNPNFNLQNIKSYKQMNEIRMKLKKLFDQQGDIVWKKSAKRRRIYDEQLSKFKVVYTRWKSETYLTYLNVNFDVPEHLNPILSMKRS